MQRRDFLTLTSGLALHPALARALERVRAQRVEAAATIFYAQPDGRASLVRFTAHGVSAPAGRLRVYDGGRRLLGTAGMLARSGALYGELWLPLEPETRLVSELEAPGVRGVHRTVHRMRPAPRWTLHWLRIVDADRMHTRIAALPPIRNAVHAAFAEATGVRGNPFAPRGDELLDHVEFLRLAADALHLARATGIPPSSLALHRAPHSAFATLPLALAGAGVPFLAAPWTGGEAVHWLEGPDGSRVLVVTIHPAGSSEALEFATSLPAMTQRIARWIETLPPAFTPGPTGDRAGGRTMDEGQRHLLVVDSQPDEPAGEKWLAVEEWNRRYAFPRITVGEDASLTPWLSAAAASAATVVRPARQSSSPRSADALRAQARDHVAAAARGTTRLLAPLGAALGVASAAQPGAPDASHMTAAVLAALAGQLDTEFPGALVFNPTPMKRTDVATMPDGTEAVVTDVPGWGYVYVPEVLWRRDETEEVPPRPPRASRTLHASGGPTPVRLDINPSTGAVSSLVTLRDGLEWVADDGEGLNGVRGAVLEGLAREGVPGVGTRLIAERWSPGRGAVRSTVTVYDALPFVDIENDAEALGDRPMTYLFGWRADGARVAWEIPAGWNEAAPPAGWIEYLRWLRLDGPAGTVVLASDQAHHAAVTDRRTVVSYAPGGRVRYRVWAGEAGAGAEDAWRIGYGSVRFAVVPVAGGGSRRLPRFGSLLRVEPAAVVALGAGPAEEADGMVLYLLNISAQSQFAAVGAGILRFRDARMVDFLGRDRGAVAGRVDDGVLVRVAARGAVALRLTDVDLNV